MQPVVLQTNKDQTPEQNPLSIYIYIYIHIHTCLRITHESLFSKCLIIVKAVLEYKCYTVLHDIIVLAMLKSVSIYYCKATQISLLGVPH